MKFLCLDCDQPMKLHPPGGPEGGSLSVTFRCPECGFGVAMLTNPFETQMVRSLGVKVGGRDTPAEPFEHLRSSLANARPDAFEGTPAGGAGGDGPGCPFAAMVNEGAAVAPAGAAWSPEAAARLERIPPFIPPMAPPPIDPFPHAPPHPSLPQAAIAPPPPT